MYGTADGDTTGIITSLIVLLLPHLFSQVLFLFRVTAVLWVLLCRVPAALIVYALSPGTSPERHLNAEPGVLILCRVCAILSCRVLQHDATAHMSV